MRNIFFPHYLSGEPKLSDINNLLLIVCIENKKPKNLLYS